MTQLRLVGLALLIALGVAAAPARPAAAQDIVKDAGTFVQSLGDSAIQIITDKALDAKGREARFHDMLINSFDVPGIGRFVLGRYWRTASEAQRTEFLALFQDMIVKTYTSRFSEYKGETFQVTGGRSDGAGGALVSTVIAQPNGRPPVKVDWRVLKPEGKLKIVDVVIEGVSMSLTQQQEFGSVIQRNGGQIDGLLATMRERVQQQSAATAKG
jgi:phospholipid transport system substrate-binding protein